MAVLFPTPRMLGLFAAVTMALCASSHALQYQPLQTVSTGAITPIFLTVADFNGDGKPDIAIPDYGGTTLSVYLGQQGGGLSAPVVTTLSVDSAVGSLLSGDFNEDGKVDLVVSGDQFSIVLLGAGDGTFAAQAPIAGSYNFSSGKVTDFNGDKHLDLFLGGNGTPYLFLGKGDGTFARGVVGSAASGDFSGTAVADFNGDGHLDGLMAEYGDPVHQLGAIDFFPGNASGSLGNATAFQPADMENPEAVDAADFNGDGKMDLLVSASGGAFVCLGNGDGTFQFQTCVVIGKYAGFGIPTVSNPDTPNVLVADLDQNGAPDAVVLEPELGQLSLIVNDGSGKFSNALTTPYTFSLPAGSYHAAVADLNGDGLPDIVAVSSTAKVISLLLSKKVLNQTVVSLTSAGGDLLLGTPLTFQVKISGGAQTPTGSVSLLDGGVQVAQQGLGSSGAATFPISNLSAGTHTLTAAYSGDANYAAGNSNSLAQVVTDFQIAATPGSQTISPGGNAAYSLAITPSSGLNATVTIACSGLPAYATCRQPILSTIFTTTSGLATVAVVVETTAPGTAAVPAAAVLLASFCLMGPGRRRKRRAIALVSIPSAVLLLILSSCSGGTQTNNGGSKQTTPGTPAGTSTITITATATQNGIATSHTASATLVVQ